MSLYEVMAVVVLVGAGGFAYRLYRRDVAREPSGEEKPTPANTLMFGRGAKADDKS